MSGASPEDARSDRVLSDTERAEVEARLGYRFVRPELLDQALTHASYSHETSARAPETPFPPHYDRLEFLGDAVIGFLLAEHAFHALPAATSGELSRSRALRARRGSLAAAGERLELGAYARLSSGERHQGGLGRRRLLADLYESIVGGIYLDGGLEAARRFLEASLLSAPGGLPSEGGSGDFKSALQEILQAEGKGTPSYRVVETGGPAHAPTFLVEVQVGGRAVGRGVGGSKQEAEQAAARVAIRSLEDAGGERT